MNGFLQSFTHPGYDLQRPADVAVVIPTILRPQIAEALRSVFRQTLPGRIQVLVGVDAPGGDVDTVARACADQPPDCAVQVIYPGYSTSVRHGGLALAQDGGVLRTVLSDLANSPYVAYLDDDNWWRPDHLATLRAAIEGKDWAFALRWFVHPLTRRPICIDSWESVGPGRGVFAERFGGFVDPSCLMINKLRCADVIPLWRRPLPGDAQGKSADRTVFNALHRRFAGSGTGEPTVFYRLDPQDANHPHRLRCFGDAYLAAGAEPLPHGG